MGVGVAVAIADAAAADEGGGGAAAVDDVEGAAMLNEVPLGAAGRCYRFQWLERDVVGRNRVRPGHAPAAEQSWLGNRNGQSPLEWPMQMQMQKQMSLLLWLTLLLWILLPVLHRGPAGRRNGKRGTLGSHTKAQTSPLNCD